MSKESLNALLTFVEDQARITLSPRQRKRFGDILTKNHTLRKQIVAGLVTLVRKGNTVKFMPVDQEGIDRGYAGVASLVFGR